MQRPRIWELGCHIVTFVVSGLLDWREVANAITSRSSELWESFDNAASTIEAAHQLSHDKEGRMAAWLEAQLDAAVGNLRHEVGQLDEEELYERIFDPSLPLEQAAPLAWALATDERVEVQDLAPLLVCNSLSLLVRKATTGQLVIPPDSDAWMFESHDLSFPDQDQFNK